MYTCHSQVVLSCNNSFRKIRRGSCSIFVHNCVYKDRQNDFVIDSFICIHFQSMRRQFLFRESLFYVVSELKYSLQNLLSLSISSLSFKVLQWHPQKLMFPQIHITHNPRMQMQILMLLICIFLVPVKIQEIYLSLSHYLECAIISLGPE